MRRLIALMAVWGLALQFVSGARYVTATDVGYSSKSDSYSQERLKLDISYPEEKGDSLIPVIVWFHGGGLTGGEKFIPSELEGRGYVVIAPNYRLIPNVDVADCIDDAAEAVAWTFANAEKFGGDPSQVFVSGHSAGGFLTSMIGLDKTRLARYGVDADSIAALIPYSGQVISHFSDRKKKGIGELTPWIDKNAPLFHVRADSPPYIIITGDAELELYGRYEENLYMWRMMKLAGNEQVRLYKLDGYDHGSMAIPAHHILLNEIKTITGVSDLASPSLVAAPESQLATAQPVPVSNAGRARQTEIKSSGPDGLKDFDIIEERENFLLKLNHFIWRK